MPILQEGTSCLNFAVVVLQSFLNSTHDATTLKITHFAEGIWDNGDIITWSMSVTVTHTLTHSSPLVRQQWFTFNKRRYAHPREKHLRYVLIVTVIQREQGVQFLWRTSFFDLFM